jgi:hypothetical protein
MMEQKSLLAATLQLNDLLHADVFLNAFRQQTARVTNQPLDELTELVATWVTPNGSMAMNNPFSAIVSK